MPPPLCDKHARSYTSGNPGPSVLCHIHRRAYDPVLIYRMLAQARAQAVVCNLKIISVSIRVSVLDI